MILMRIMKIELMILKRVVNFYIIHSVTCMKNSIGTVPNQWIIKSTQKSVISNHLGKHASL